MRAGLPTVLFVLFLAAAVALAGWWVAAPVTPTAKPADTAIAPRSDGDTPPATAVIRVMTANVRIAEPADGINAWPNRREFLVKTLLKYGPDLIGCQEVTPAQKAYLVKELGKWYEHFPKAGVGNVAGDDAGGPELLGMVSETFASLNTLFFRADRFEIIDGEAGLALPGQLQKEATENTFFTLAVLREKPGAGSQKPEVTWLVVDTHLRHHEAFAEQCAVKIREKIGGMLKKYPAANVVLMGDMNHDRTSKVYAALIGGPGAADGVGALTDSFDYSKKRPGETWGNWHAFTGRPQQEWPTDLIFAGPGVAAKGTQFIRDRDAAGHYPSDHFFVMTDLQAK